MVQWLGFCTSTAGGMGSTPGQGAKISHAPRLTQPVKFWEDFPEARVRSWPWPQSCDGWGKSVSARENLKRVRQERVWCIPGHEAQPEWVVPQERGGLVGDGAEGATAAASPDPQIRTLAFEELWESLKHLEQ